MKPKEMKRTVLVFALGLLVYSNAFFVNFLWDDIGLIVNNPLIKDFKYLPQLFSSGIFVGESAAKNFYRPLQALTNMFDFYIWKDIALGYHLTNIALHITCAILLYYLFALIFKKGLAAFLSALLFLVHPVNVETVTYISGRADSLLFLFLLFSFINYLNFRRKLRKRFLAYSVVFFTFGIFSKELAVSAVFIYPLIDYALDKSKEYKYYAVFVLISIIFFSLRFSILGFPLAQNNFGFLARFLTFIVSILGYLKALFFPANLHMSYTTKVFTYINAIFALKFSLLLSIFLLFRFLLRRDKKIFIFCSAWFFIFLIPQSGIFPINAYFAEHFIYLSQYPIFFALLCAVFQVLNNKYNFHFYALFALIAFALAMSTFSYTRDWINPVKFYQRIILFSPNSFAAYNNLGAEFEKRGLREEARKQFLRALSINPKDILAYNNLGKSYMDDKEINKAIAIFKQGIRQDPQQSVLHFNLAKAYELIGDNDNSDIEYEKAFRLAQGVAPWDPSICLKLGLLYYREGKFGQASEEFRKAIRLNPNDAALYVNLGLAYKAQGKIQQAVNEYLKALSLDPNFSQGYNNLGVTYAQVGDKEQALKYFLKAIVLDNKYDEARFNLGLLYIEMSDFKKAKEQLVQISNKVSFYPLVAEQLKKIEQKDIKRFLKKPKTMQKSSKVSGLVFGSFSEASLKSIDFFGQRDKISVTICS